MKLPSGAMSKLSTSHLGSGATARNAPDYFAAGAALVGLGSNLYDKAAFAAKDTAALVAQIKARVLLHYAGQDERINAGRAAYEAAMKAANVRFESFVYEGKQHAFHNDTNTARYDKAAADLAWTRTLGLFSKTL